MSEYRYVVFPRGGQPSPEEVRAWQSLGGLLANHYAWGYCRDDRRLALACEAEAFERTRPSVAEFDALVARWEARGAEVRDHLKFVKDPAALRPARPAAVPAQPAAPLPAAPGDALRPELREAAKQYLAQESVARSLLGTQRSLERFETLHRLAAAGPYVLIGAAALGTLTAGLYVWNRLNDPGRERRQETIERVAEMPLRNAPIEDPDDRN